MNVQLLAGVDHSLFFWPPTGIALAILLLRGRRMFPAIFIGNIAGLLWGFDLLHAFFSAAIATGHAVLGCTLIRRAWPRRHHYIPSARFFAIMMVAGALVPSSLTVWPSWYLLEQHVHTSIGASQGILEWWLGDCISITIFTPALLLFLPSFRENGWHSVKSMLWTFAQIALCLYVAWFVMTKGGPRPIMAITVLIVLGCVISLRCGVAGVIVANVALLVVATCIQAGFGVSSGTNISLGMQTEFDAIIFEVTCICLLVAGGFYDYWRADREFHRVSARILQAQEIERRRLSANLHDGVSQTIFAAIMRLRLAAAGGPSPERPAPTAEMEAVAEDLSKALKDLRRTTAGLRPEMLDQSPFAHVLADYCTEVEKRAAADILFSDETAGEADKLALNVREHLFRLVQEAISNATQHGKASLVRITFSQSKRKSGWLRLRIADNGGGFDQSADEEDDRMHLGLRTMDERARVIGGSLRINSRPGYGTIVTVSVPFTQETKSANEESPSLLDSNS